MNGFGVHTSMWTSGWTVAEGSVAKSSDAAVFLTIANGVTPDRLIAAKAPLAKSAA